MVKNWLVKHKYEIGSAILMLAVFAILTFGFGSLVKVKAEQPVVTNEYKVLTVYQYSAPVTNGYGGVKRHETKYHVTYINNDGDICDKEMYNAAATSEKPYEAVYMGEETKLVITSKGSTSWYALYLTEQDFQEMRYKLIESE